MSFSTILQLIRELLTLKKQMPVTEPVKSEANVAISLRDYLTASGAYPERESSTELTPEFLLNATRLLKNVNSLLSDLGIQQVKISSGFRPASVNERVANAAKKSLHMQCLAVDILDDKNQTFASTFAANPDLLRKYNLFLESPVSTKGQNTNWSHLDMGARKDRPSRIFLP